MYIFDADHWEVAPVSTFVPFFSALSILATSTSLLCLSDGTLDAETADFLERRRSSRPSGLDIPSDFSTDRWLKATPEALAGLAVLAETHAEPEIAIHLALRDQAEQVLEWFDAPLDPISISLRIPEARVAEFAAALGVTYRKR